MDQVTSSVPMPAPQPRNPLSPVVVIVLVCVVLGIGGLILFMSRAPREQNLSQNSATVPGGYGCPAVSEISIADFPENKTEWIQAAFVMGSHVPILIPKGDRPVTEETMKSLGFARIIQSPAIKDPASFKIYYRNNYNMYGTDQYNAYYIHTPKDFSTWEQTVSVIPGADPKTFVDLDIYYSADATHVYYAGLPIPNAAPENFRVLKQYGYAVLGTSGGLALLNGQHRSVTDEDIVPVPHDITPLEALFVKNREAEVRGKEVAVLASTSETPAQIPDGAEMRLLATTADGSIRAYLPSVYGVFTEGSDTPVFCVATEDRAALGFAVFKSHLLISFKRDYVSTIEDTDLSEAGNHAVSYFSAPNRNSTLILDSKTHSVFSVENDVIARTSLIRVIPFSDFVSQRFTGNVIFKNTFSFLYNLLLSPDSSFGVAIDAHGQGGDGPSDLVTINLADGKETVIGLAHGERVTSGTTVPLFFSKDSSKLYYWVAPYEGDGSAYYAFVHMLADSASLVGSRAELTPIIVYQYLVSPDNETVYYWYPKKKQMSCTLDSFTEISDTLVSRDTNTGAEHDIYTAPGNSDIRLVSWADKNTLAVTLSMLTATTTTIRGYNGAPDRVEPCLSETGEYRSAEVGL